MNQWKKPLIGLLAMAIACGLLVPSALAEEIPAEEPVTEAAAEPEAPETEAIVGAWKLYQINEIQEGVDPTALSREENESLYGAGISIYNFDDAGVAHHITFDAGESIDLTGTWETTDENVYLYKDDPDDIILRYVPEEDMLHRELPEDGRTLDYVYARAFVGSWKLVKVQAMIEGEAPWELSQEDSQTYYGAGTSVLVLDPDGTGREVVTTGEEPVEIEGTWTSEKPNRFVYTQEGQELGFTYFSANDAIFRDVKDETSIFPHLRFIYQRVGEDAEAAQGNPIEQLESPDTSQQEVSYSDDVVYDPGYYEDPDPGWTVVEPDPSLDDWIVIEPGTELLDEPVTEPAVEPGSDEPVTDAPVDPEPEPAGDAGLEPAADAGASDVPVDGAVVEAAG